MKIKPQALPPVTALQLALRISMSVFFATSTLVDIAATCYALEDLDARLPFAKAFYEFKATITVMSSFISVLGVGLAFALYSIARDDVLGLLFGGGRNFRRHICGATTLCAIIAICAIVFAVQKPGEARFYANDDDSQYRPLLEQLLTVQVFLLIPLNAVCAFAAWGKYAASQPQDNTSDAVKGGSPP